MNFFEKFFLQSNDKEYLLSVFGKGEGEFGYRHLIWAIVTLALTIILYKVFKKYNKAGKYFLLISSIALFATRTINQTYRGFAGLENPWWAAFPFHLCTVLTFVVPIVCVFNLKKIKSGVYACALIGGVVTVIFGEYFDYKFLSFSQIEGMLAHMLLIFIPFTEIAISKFKFEIKEIYKAVISMGVAAIWATLANYVFFKGYDKNYLYLRKNALPFDTAPVPFILVYLVLFAIALFLIYGIPHFYGKRKSE